MTDTFKGWLCITIWIDFFQNDLTYNDSVLLITSKPYYLKMLRQFWFRHPLRYNNQNVNAFNKFTVIEQNTRTENL